jgi:hypothetical protein
MNNPQPAKERQRLTMAPAPPALCVRKVLLCDPWVSALRNLGNFASKLQRFNALTPSGSARPIKRVVVPA